MVTRTKANQPKAVGVRRLRRSQIRVRKPKIKKWKVLVSPTPWVDASYDWYTRWVGGSDRLRALDSIMDDAWVLGHEGDRDPTAACLRRFNKLAARGLRGGLVWKLAKAVKPTR